MSTQWQNDVTEQRAHAMVKAPIEETPIENVNVESVPNAQADDRSEIRAAADRLLWDIASGFGYIGMARWSRDDVIVHANLRCALRVLQSIDARLAEASPAHHPARRKIEAARDRLRNRLLEEFSELLDRVVHDLPSLTAERSGAEAVH